MLRHADRLKIALAQLDLLVGDVRGNLERVIAEARRARDELQADLVLFPELTLSGYPPEDLLFHRGLRLQIGRALDELTRAVPEIGVMVGYPEYAPGHIYNAACLIRGGRVLAQHRKACLPNYKVFDEKRYFTAPAQRNKRFAVLHNLPGTPTFCPLVRRTPALRAWIEKDLGARIAQVLASLEPELLARAVNYLYLAETRSSFAIEKDVPDSQRAERFRRLLERAGEDMPLEEQTFVEWQNVIAPRLRAEFSYRQKQNWLSRSGRSTHVADYIPPAPAGVPGMIEGIVKVGELVKSNTYPPVLAAACASFGFVFVHPFFDGNGRLHRFLLHHLLRLGGFTPPGAVVPVSAAMERDLARYAEVLKHYSAPRTAMLDYRLDSDANFIDVKPQPQYLYAFFDATELCEFTFACLERAIDQDLADELAYLRAYDSAHQALTRWLDAPQPELEKLIRYIAQNNGHLSKNKRGQFPLIGDDDIARAETQIGQAFATYWKRSRPNKATDVSSHTS